MHKRTANPNITAFFDLINRDCNRPYMYEKKISLTTVGLAKFAILYATGQDLPYSKVEALMKEEYGRVY